MSNRFHSKFHRQNHHTYTSVTNPDAGHDPIASREQPFWGDFVLAGALSCVAPASAVAGYFNSNFTALCAIAGQRGQYIYSFGNLGLEVYSAQSTAISAVGPYMGANISSNVYGINVYGGQYGINTNSPFYGINSYGGTHGGNYYSPIRALSAFGGQFGLQVYSPFYGIDSYGGIYAGRFNSPIRALSAFGGNIGLDLYSPVSGIYAFGGSAGGIFSSPIRALSANGGIVGFEVYSPISAINAFGGIVGARVYSPRRALSAYGGTIGFDVYSPQIAINAIGLNTGINVYSQNTAISSVANDTGMNVYGGSLGAVISSPVVSLSTGGIGINRFDNRVGIFRTPQQNYPTSPNIVFDVNGNSYFDGNITITGDLSALGNLSYLDTIVYTTSSLRVVNRTASAASTFIQYGTDYPTLVCYDGDESLSVPTFTVLNKNIGINLSSPSNTFTVNSPITITDLTNGSQYAIALNNNGGINGDLAFGSDNTNSYIQSFNSNTLKLNSIGSNNIIIAENGGNVGIGTNTPSVKLTVNGQISANNTITGATLTSNGNINATSGTITGATLTSNGNINATSGTITGATLVSNGSITSSTNATIGGTLSATNIANARPSILGAGTNVNVAYTVNNWETSLISNVPTGFTLTLTLPNPATNPGRWLYIKSLSIAGNGGAVVSAGPNVDPLGSTTAGTAILAAGGSRWAQLQSDGTDWIIMASN